MVDAMLAVIHGMRMAAAQREFDFVVKPGGAR